jgi:hypothetical protein
MLWKIGLELLLLSSVCATEGHACVSGWLLLHIHHIKLIATDSVGRLNDHAARLLMLYLRDQMTIVLHILHHQIVV